MALGANKIFFWGVFASQSSSTTYYLGFDGTNGATSYKSAPYAMSMAFLGSKTINNIFCSPATAFVLTNDGYVFGMGFGGVNQLDPGGVAVALSNTGFSQAYGLNPNTFNDGEYVTSIVPNTLNTVVVTNKRAYIWGSNSGYQIGQVPLTFSAIYPIEIISPGNKITKVFTNNMPSTNTLLYFYAALTDGCSYPTVTLSREATDCVGGNIYYSTTARTLLAYNSGMIADRKIIDIQSNGGFFEGYGMFLTSAGRVYSYGGAENGRVGDGSTATSAVFKTVSTTVMNTFIVIIATGYTSAGAVSSNNQFYVWGYSSYGETTDGEGNGRTAPVLGYRGEIGSRIILDMQGGTQRFGVLTADGRVFLWGSNYFGTCFVDRLTLLGGIGNGLGASGGGTHAKFPTSPTMTGALNGVTLIKMAIGGLYTLVLDTQNNLYAWGVVATVAGGINPTTVSTQLGVGNGVGGTFSTTPAAIPMTPFGNKTITDISAAAANAMVMTSDGTIYAFGDNTYSLVCLFYVLTLLGQHQRSSNKYNFI